MNAISPSRARLAAAFSLVFAAWALPAGSAELPVVISEMTYDRARHSLVLDISGPVTISTRSLRAPARLVVDVPAARLKFSKRELQVGDAMVQRVRVAQFKILPPIVRVVIETAPKDEPLIAVQQTDKQLFITLAPARPIESRPSPSPRVVPTPRLRATPTPTPSALRPLPVVVPSARPTAAPQPRPVSTPSAEGRPTRASSPTPRPTPSPRPTATPTPVPSAQPAPVLRRGSGGEAAWETLPVLPAKGTSTP